MTNDMMKVKGFELGNTIRTEFNRYRGYFTPMVKDNSTVLVDSFLIRSICYTTYENVHETPQEAIFEGVRKTLTKLNIPFTISKRVKTYTERGNKVEEFWWTIEV